ncbi:hypothetical protein [Paractinoplanes abujensis]|uniref:Uncharacterized protein n=1 Tax=Paractinoplanes abujensis TaxID=882441 RepID=A0A7W7CY06_9ACTN|nr:hypothetical protein [Actinoplanes abujensis]MBB4695388.1 hypothetical protein [Actinoplanes abujensis]
MIARKLGRFAGLVFVLAAVFGGVAAVATSDADGLNSAAARTYNSGPVQTTNGGLEWE